jgi:hypothetical protein
MIIKFNVIAMHGFSILFLFYKLKKTIVSNLNAAKKG